MRSSIKHIKKSASALKSGVCVNIVTYLCLIFTLPSCQKNIGQTIPSPPDLSRCTRLEIKYFPSTLEGLYTAREQEDLLNSSERQYLESLETIVVDDPEQIKKLAYDLSLGRYH